MDVCGRVYEQCACSIPTDKCDGRHLCMHSGCGGSWHGKGVARKEDIIMIPSKQPWPEHIELSERMLNMTPEEAAIAHLLGWDPVR